MYKRQDIKGSKGISLKDQWKNGAKSYLGLGISNFPNLFTVTGPGSPSVLSNMVPSLELHVEWISDCIEWMRDNNKKVIEAQSFIRGLERRQKTLFLVGQYILTKQKKEVICLTLKKYWKNIKNG